tara:strand:- start:25514 stop:25891 length:378 start_codon:yes stop_codon:yes gene_type:complete
MAEAKKKGGTVSRVVYDRQMSNLDALGKQLKLSPQQIQAMKDNYAADHHVKGTRVSSSFVKLSEMNKGYASMLSDIQERMDKFNALVRKDGVKFAKVQTQKAIKEGKKPVKGQPYLTCKFEIVTD